MSSFIEGFEKRAYYMAMPITSYSSTFPLESEKAKKQYVEDRASSGRLSGGLAGGVTGMSMGALGSPLFKGKDVSLKHMGVSTGVGAAIGTLGGMALGHYFSKRKGEQHANAGVGSSRGHYERADAYAAAKKYTDLNKEASLIGTAVKEFEAGTKTLVSKGEEFIKKTKPPVENVLDYSKFNPPRVWKTKPMVKTEMSPK